MGICGGENNSTPISNNNGCTNNSTSITKDDNENNQISFRCFYDVKNIDEKIRILYDGHGEHVSKEIKSKIKILNDNKKEELIFTKKVNIIGINTIDFIIEGKLTKMCDIFKGCISLIKIEFIFIDTSQVKYMDFMFHGCHSLEYLDLSNFDTSNVESMMYMFDCCFKLKEIKGINNFNTSKVKSMSNMFNFCESLEYLDLSNFNTSNVDDMCCMFHLCVSLEYLNISNFNTSNVKDMRWMFSACYKLKEIKGINNLKIETNCRINEIFKDSDKLDYLDISDNKITIDIHKLIWKDEKNEKIISIMFFIPDKNIHYPIPCNESDLFSTIEFKLFEEFPELKSKNIYYLVNGSTVNKFTTLEQNKIKNGDTILINYIDDDN